MSSDTVPSYDAQAIVGAISAVLPAVGLVILFGSVARGTARPDSDIDIAVLADRPLDASAKMNLIESLALQSGRSVDLIDLRTVGEPLLGKILAEGIPLIDKGHHRGALLARHLGNAEDFIPLQEFILRSRRQAWTRQ
ncbi:MAG: nucleotidyltransferase domain-containing protein [Alcanivoracaceae bacterium]|jgi:predicted nucleotidyltransferase|nr:nucleotidyltransferase domain-containing protein [Alcanivoracaceae bacterium]